MTDNTSLAAQAWNAWWNSVSTGANDKHMETAFISGFEAADQRCAELEAENARLKSVAWAWLSYDQLLRQYAGPMSRIGEGEWELADTTYDKCVKATVKALENRDD